MDRLTYKELMSGYYPNEDILDTDCFDKLGKLEDLEDELGCPLEVVFKALKEGAIEDEDGGIQIVGITIGGDGEFYLHAINGDLYLLKDYQKTWWLKGIETNDRI